MGGYEGTGAGAGRISACRSTTSPSDGVGAVMTERRRGSMMDISASMPYSSGTWVRTGVVSSRICANASIESRATTQQQSA